MLKIGNYNDLEVSRLSQFGVYLTDGKGNEVLLPTKYIAERPTPGQKVDGVFVYTDSSDRPVATTEHPHATVGEFAVMKVADTNRVGVFLDWGLMEKQLLLPFSEQGVRLRKGMTVPVYVHLDPQSGRVVASARIERHLSERVPRSYEVGHQVHALVYRHEPELGYKAIVNNRYRGFIYHSDLHEPLSVGTLLDAMVKQVRPDGKIDLVPGAKLSDRLNDLAPLIIERLRQTPDHTLPLGDKSSPDQIRALFDCSKKDFKRALGQLYRARKITLEAESISLA